MKDHETPNSNKDGSQALSERINIATRSTHSQLNRSILSRLPLALPPHASNPSIYITGLLHITPIYITFETLWQELLESPHLLPLCKVKDGEGCSHQCLSQSDSCDPGAPLLDSHSLPLLSNAQEPALVHSPTSCTRIHSILNHLRFPGLLRAGRLQADIRTLAQISDDDIDQQLKEVSEHGKLSKFVAHTTCTVKEQPQVLLAYAWVLYMAIFSGGRYIRAVLQAAGGTEGDFWAREPSPVRPYVITNSKEHNRSSSKNEQSKFSNMKASALSPKGSEERGRNMMEQSATYSGCQFLSFSGSEDGEDIKREFKKRLAEAEDLLTASEKDDIVAEAQHIFDYMVHMINQLDEVCETSTEAITKMTEGHRPLRASRDSVQLTKERLPRQDKPSSLILESKNRQHLLTKETDSKTSEGKTQSTCSSPKIVRFDDLQQPSRIPSLRRGLTWFTKPLGRRVSREGFSKKPSSTSTIELGPLLISSITTAFVVVVFTAWYFQYTTSILTSDQL